MRARHDARCRARCRLLPLPLMMLMPLYALMMRCARLMIFAA